MQDLNQNGGVPCPAFWTLGCGCSARLMKCDCCRLHKVVSRLFDFWEYYLGFIGVKVVAMKRAHVYWLVRMFQVVDKRLQMERGITYTLDAFGRPA